MDHIHDQFLAKKLNVWIKKKTFIHNKTPKQISTVWELADTKYFDLNNFQTWNQYKYPVFKKNPSEFKS